MGAGVGASWACPDGLGAVVAGAEAGAADVAVASAAAPNAGAPELVPAEGPYPPSGPQAELAINTSNSNAKLASVMRRRISVFSFGLCYPHRGQLSGSVSRSYSI